jgi:hypothetical protein
VWCGTPRTGLGVPVGLGGVGPVDVYADAGRTPLRTCCSIDEAPQTADRCTPHLRCSQCEPADVCALDPRQSLSRLGLWKCKDAPPNHLSQVEKVLVQRKQHRGENLAPLVEVLCMCANIRADISESVLQHTHNVDEQLERSIIVYSLYIHVNRGKNSIRTACLTNSIYCAFSST